jgi:hypothetical protein
LFNIIIQLDQKGIEYKILLKESLIEEKETLLVLFEIYDFYIRIRNSIGVTNTKNVLKFVNNELYNTFSRPFITDLGKSNKEVVAHFANDLFKVIKRTENTIFYDSIKNMPIYILEILILEKSPISNIKLFISTWLDQETWQKENLFKFLLKIMIENYADSNDNNLIILEILKNLTKVFDCNTLVNDLEIKIGIIEFLSKQKIKISLLDLLKAEYLIINNKISFNESDLYKKLLLGFYSLFKAKKNRFSFIDDNGKINYLITEYLKKFNINFSNLILDTISQNNLKSYSLKILLENQNYFNENLNIIENFIDFFIDAKNEMDLTNEAIFSEFLADIKSFLQKYQYIDKSITFKLQNISRFYQISSVFVNNTIDIDLKDFDYKKLNLNDLLEIFILKKFNIDQIIDLGDFIHKTEDIYEAFGIEKNEYFELLFQFFLKYQKERLYTEILEYFGENDYKRFEECIKKKNFNLKTFFAKNPKLKLKLLESTERYDYLEEVMEDEIFKKNPKIKFNIENEDAICLLDLEEKIQNLPKKFENVNQGVINEINQLEGFKNKLFKFVETLSQNITDEPKRSTFKYSLHPKLVKLLKDINFKHSGKEFEFNTKLAVKFKLYKYFIGNNLASLNDILEWENLTKFESYQDAFNIHKLLINIYSDKMKFDQFFNIDIVNNNRHQLIRDLIIFNLSYLKYFNRSHFEYIKLLDINFLKLDMNLKVVELLDSLCGGKLNILVLISNYSQMDNLIKDELKKLYINNQNICYFKNIKSNETKLLIMNEFYKNLNMNNFINLYKVNKILDLDININLLFAIKLCVSLTNISCVINEAKKGCDEIIQVLSSLQITDDEFKTLSHDLFNLPTVSYILESHLGINILEKNYAKTLQDFITIKLILVDEIMNKVPVLNKWPIMMNNLKILRIKHYILHYIEESEVIDTYNKIKDIADFSEIENLYKKNDRMKEQIRNIYTKLN